MTHLSHLLTAVLQYTNSTSDNKVSTSRNESHDVIHSNGEDTLSSFCL